MLNHKLLCVNIFIGFKKNTERTVAKQSLSVYSGIRQNAMVKIITYRLSHCIHQTRKLWMIAQYNILYTIFVKNNPIEQFV